MNVERPRTRQAPRGPSAEEPRTCGRSYLGQLLVEERGNLAKGLVGVLRKTDLLLAVARRDGAAELGGKALGTGTSFLKTRTLTSRDSFSRGRPRLWLRLRLRKEAIVGCYEGLIFKSHGSRPR